MSDSADKEIANQLAALESQPPRERAAALMQLGWTHQGQPTPLIETFLEDPDAVVRIAAAQACWQTAADPAALERLVGIIADELSNDDELALMAGTALVNIGEAAVPMLIRRFSQDENKNPLVVRVIGEIAGDEALQFLQKASLLADMSIVEEAKEALEAIEEEDQT